MNELVFKGNQKFMDKEIPIIYGGFEENQKCLSDKTVAELHNMDTFKVRERITNNIKRFKGSVDFIDLKIVIRQEDNNLLSQLGYTNMEIGKSNHIYILSRRGYAKLIKIFDTDLAWEIYEKLLDGYFYLKEQESSQIPFKTEEDRKLEITNQLYKFASINGISEKYKDICIVEALKLLTNNSQLSNNNNLKGTTKTTDEAPKVKRFIDEIESNIISNPLFAYTTRMIAEKYGVNASKLNRQLEVLDIQYKQEGVWILNKRYRFRSYKFMGDNSHKWTPIGAKFIHRILKENGIYPLDERENVIK